MMSQQHRRRVAVARCKWALREMNKNPAIKCFLCKQSELLSSSEAGFGNVVPMLTSFMIYVL